MASWTTGRVIPVPRVLADLPPDTLRALQGSMEHLRVGRGECLAAVGTDVRYAYLPIRGVVALLATGLDGETAHVGVIGADSMVGLPVLLQERIWSYAVMAPLAGECYRLRASTLLTALARDEALQRVLRACAHDQLRQMTDAAVCHRCHTVIQRLSAWVLRVSQSVGQETLDITQELLAQLLGTPRTAVSVATTRLQDDGILRQRHGRLHILHRRRLQAHACACVQSSLDERGPVAAGRRGPTR